MIEPCKSISKSISNKKFTVKIRLGIYVNIQNFKLSSLYHTFVLKAQSHLDVWHERVNIMWENQQHVQKRACVPVNHPSTCLSMCQTSWERLIIVSVLSQGGYSLYVGSYICANVLTPLFWSSEDWTQCFGGTFSHPPTSKRSFWLPNPSRIFLAPNSIFALIFRVQFPVACGTPPRVFQRSTSLGQYHMVTFSQRFHSVCVRVPTCQRNIQHVPNLCVMFKYCPLRVCSDSPACFKRAPNIKWTVQKHSRVFAVCWE